MTDKVEYNRKQVVKYLIWTFILAYAIQFAAAYIWNNVNAGIGALIVAAMMFVPTLGVFLAGGKLKGMGWNPRIRKNIGSFLIAWFMPIVFTALGAALYFLGFPHHLDLSGAAVSAGTGVDVLAQLEAQGLTFGVYLLISVIEAAFFAPLLNMALALGEEIGWRGFLYPQLKARFGSVWGRILGGVIWGAWHWPLIWLIGYEYGASAMNNAGYFGFPVTGMLVFCVGTVAWGILHDWLYERSGSIWVPSLLHGAINASASLPLLLCLPDTGTLRLLGPAPNGLLACIPFFVVAAIVLLRGKEEPAVE